MRFLAWGAVGAAIYGVIRGMRNGNVQQLVKDFPSNLNPSNLQQMIQPLAGMATAGTATAGMAPARMTQPLAAMAMYNSSTKNQTKKQGV
ncbi:hypothetical protein [Paenisporosarcina sp. OV554]|uniref:hypothetical protein n=1 Tax=Paenisporosarcina sp. OV554 TaxID=2135694 RepID=UPI000D3C3052|nr:hypothetical protein [Paenisporosarcina sp. OV554]PUB11728.1 hypothetical protein C8K15_11297 [Paenisporosarcina sp. OV554]